MDKVLSYFNGDVLSAEVWASKYQMKDRSGNPVEETPTDMHKRLSKEFARVEYSYIKKELEKQKDSVHNLSGLSAFGEALFFKRASQSLEDIEQEFFNYFDKFSKIVPQGSIMSNLGNFFVFGSLSNCFGIAPPSDSYAGIIRADQELVQLMKRRGGVGLHLNNLRPYQGSVSNAAKSSSGAAAFAERYSNSTREVAQEGRRGALMELLSCKHPDIFRFVRMKADRTKVTGANVSVMFTNKFMEAVEADEDFVCTFPINNDSRPALIDLEYNKLTEIEQGQYVMKIKAKELFEEFVHQAHDNAEPGAAYIDTIIDYCPDGVYTQYIPEVCNPCGEQWFHAYETCRLMALNFFGMIKRAFTDTAEIDWELLYECAYMQQRLGDDLVDLEVEYIDRILEKLRSDLDNIPIDEVQEHSFEIHLWMKIKTIAQEGRRTGNGFTGLGDMMAALGVGYENPAIIEEVMKVKIQAELDATIDMSILRGSFTGWDRTLEMNISDVASYHGKNSFFQMILEEFPEQASRMYEYGRRNVSWSTVAPTGTVSLMTQTTSGLEPLFKAYYIRRKKINPNDKDVRIDFTDQNGDKWMEYAVLHPKFREYCAMFRPNIDTDTSQWLSMDKHYNSPEEVPAGIWAKVDTLPKETIAEYFKLSPWFGSEAEDISWENRIEIQSVIQKYTSNAISSTINLPSGVSKETVASIYISAWKKGLKGVTIYRDGSRTGVLINDKKVSTDKFGYTNAIKRPVELEADYHYITSGGNRYAVIVGLLDNKPFEIFAFDNPIVEKKLKGIITKVASGVYSFKNGVASHTIDNIQLSAFTEERVLTRWTSQLLRHGVNPKYIAEQVEKSEVMITSFAKGIARVLKTYIADEKIEGELCSNCNQPTLVREEGCKKCKSCGYSAC